MYDVTFDTVHPAKELENDKELREALSLLSNHKINIVEFTDRYSFKPEVGSIPANGSGCGCGCS